MTEARMLKLRGYFIYSAGLLLAITAVAKFISSLGNAHILNYADPLLAISFRRVFWIVGTLEVAVALVCIFGKSIRLQTGLLAWLTTSFLVYRLGLIWVNYQKPCSCLGNLTDALHIPPQTADTAMKIVLAYLLIGSYGTLLWLWRQKRKTPLSTSSPGTFVSGM